MLGQIARLATVPFSILAPLAQGIGQAREYAGGNNRRCIEQHAYAPFIIDGSHRAMPGKAYSKKANATMISANGMEARATAPSRVSLAIDCTANRFRPMGGVSAPSSMNTTMMMPVQTPSKPMAMNDEYRMGTVSNMIDNPSMNMPTTRYTTSNTRKNANGVSPRSTMPLASPWPTPEVTMAKLRICALMVMNITTPLVIAALT